MQSEDLTLDSESDNTRCITCTPELQEMASERIDDLSTNPSTQ